LRAVDRARFAAVRKQKEAEVERVADLRMQRHPSGRHGSRHLEQIRYAA